jgi:hypothetical protein
MSYGVDIIDTFRQVGGRILVREPPADELVVFSTRRATSIGSNPLCSWPLGTTRDDCGECSKES